VAALIAIETVVLVLLTVLVAGLLRSHATILRRLHELGAGIEDAPGTPASPRAMTPSAAGHADATDVVGVGLRDDVVSVRVRDVEHRTLLAFLSSGCLTCREFWDAFDGRDPLGLPVDVRIVIVTKGPEEEDVKTIDRLAPAHLPLVMSSDTWRDYEVPGSPYFVLADGPSGRVLGEGTGASWPQVLGLVGRADDGADARRRDGVVRTGELPDITNAARIDAELHAAGVEPGDPSLYGSAPAAGGAADRKTDRPTEGARTRHS
jgi:hypothetical protein